MSYLPPAGGAVNFTLVGTYAAPSAGAVNFSLGEFIPEASGFVSTQFGTPGVIHTAYGAGSVTQFGTPTGWEHYNATSLGRVTQWNYPFTAYVAHYTVAESEGFLATKFGFPQLVTPPFKPARTYCGATGFKTTAFGTPFAQSTGTVQATGTVVTAFGQASCGQTYAATGLNNAATFGQAKAVTAAKAMGFRPTNFGTATARATYNASSRPPTNRWGIPTATRSNTYQAYGLNCSGRFGRPTGFERFNYTATGFCSTQFGTHSSSQDYRATSLPPVARFGTPLLMRYPTC